ncbi:MAG: RagB/SusD family nutrient uptake outer membrane protein, partial [Schleiferiaceae bacterium]
TPNFADIFTRANEHGPESVFEIVYSENSTVGWEVFGSGYGEGNVGVQFCGMRDFDGPVYAPGWGFAPVSQELYDAMAGDPRRPFTIINADSLAGSSYSPGYQNTGYFMYKYAPRKDALSPDGEPALNWGTNVRVIRYADVLLMAAEGLARSGGSEATARGYLNQVRQRAGLQPIQASGAALLDAIAQERRFELATEGHRFFDLVRTGKAAQVLGAKGFVANKHEWLPIPQTEIDAAQGALTQNPNY